jgi:hypothetical protein
MLELDKIHCGDNCDLLGQLPRECIDLVVTSPPYDDLRTYGGHSWDFFGVAWQLKRVLKPGGVIVWVVADATKDGSETGSSMEQALHFKRLGLNLHDTMVWQKTPLPMNHNRYEQVWEYMFVLCNGTPKVFNGKREACRNFGRGFPGGSTRQGGNDAREHNTQKRRERGQVARQCVGGGHGIHEGNKRRDCLRTPGDFPGLACRRPHSHMEQPRRLGA